jgi:hypothetical protein
MLQTSDEFAKVAYEYSDAPDSNQRWLISESLSKNELPEIFITQARQS